jgi:hypothetical protein
MPVSHRKSRASITLLPWLAKALNSNGFAGDDPIAKSIFVHFSAACARLAAGQNIG